MQFRIYKLMLAVGLCILVVVVPLFAGYCLDCPQPVSCSSGCTPGIMVSHAHPCAVCAGTIRKFCTVCEISRYVCTPPPGGFCHPPYEWRVQEINRWGVILCRCIPTATGHVDCWCL